MRKQPIELPHSCPKKPTVSVIVPTYNHEDYINECIDGILMQEDCDFEAIIIEDESSDRTREICIARQKERPDRLRLILNHRENNIHIHGRPTGRFSVLYALERCRGGYIALCEGDDFWVDAQKLRIQANILTQIPDISIVLHKVQTLSKDGKINFLCGRPPADGRFPRSLLVSSYPSQTSSFFLRRANLKIPQEVKHTISFDSMLLAIMATLGDGYFCASIKPNIRRPHPGGTWSGISNEEQQNHSRRTRLTMLLMLCRMHTPSSLIAIAARPIFRQSTEEPIWQRTSRRTRALLALIRWLARKVYRDLLVRRTDENHPARQIKR